MADENNETRAVVRYIGKTRGLYFEASTFIAGHGDAPWRTARAHEMRVWVETRCIWKDVEKPATLQTDLTLYALDDVDWDAVVERLKPAV